MSGMSLSSIGALNTAFIRLTIASQYGLAAEGGRYCAYSAEWQATQLAVTLAKPGSGLSFHWTPSGGSWMVLGVAKAMLVAASAAAPARAIRIVFMARLLKPL